MAGDEELPWNVSRCNRLLRPLSSKLAKLRRELELPRIAHQEPRTISSAFATKATPRKTTNFTRAANKPRGFEKARDPDWRPGAKGTKRTYGGRKMKKLAGPRTSSADVESVARPGEVAFTPLIARMGGHMLDSPLAHVSPLKKYTKPRGPLVVPMDHTDSLGARVPADVHKLMQGVLEAYANILRATDEERSRSGAGSLMHACLKKLPAYIELEEHFAELDQLEDDDEDDADVAGDIFAHLESRFEQRRGHGWRPFKHVVRAHGTSLLCSAIADGIITTNTLGYFHSHCLAVGAYDEAEDMLVAALPALEPLPIPFNVQADLFGEKSVYMSAAKAYVDRTGRHRFLYDLLEHMVAHELLPLEWLATTHMRPVWDRLVRTITEGDSRTLASCQRFLETCALAGMGLPDEGLLADQVTGSIARRFVPSSRDDLRQALDTTYSSLLTVLCSIALVNSSREEAAGKATARRITHTLDTITVALASRSDIDAELRLLEADCDDLQIFAQRASWTVFASFLVHLEELTQDENTVSLSTPTLIRSLSNVMRHYASNGVNSSATLATLPTLISAIARGTGRVWHDDGFGQLQSLVHAMTHLSGHRLPHKLWTLKRIALESATEFATYTDEAAHLRYANDVEKQMRSSGRLVIMPTPRKTDTPSSAAAGGFRWEDGIGEWVACTPFDKHNACRLKRGRVRSLSLLPTPAPSSSSSSSPNSFDEDITPDDDVTVNDKRQAETQDSDLDTDTEPIFPSSPTKHSFSSNTRATNLRKRKRTRASSPMVLIRTISSHPFSLSPAFHTMSPARFYPQLPYDMPGDTVSEDGSENSRRHLRRRTCKARDVKIKRGRSRGRGLRDLGRVGYAVHAGNEGDEAEAEWTSGEGGGGGEEQEAEQQEEEEEKEEEDSADELSFGI
ncbi:hypothetical protein EKO04_011240 [Ascochyta lentis]|uniref:Uncharacterized protein n=1 Tax=Ascochyta lentis TaxID=205686 RepID=A0A8H7MBH4_9PLEO|nr:hypothetical protein EKO04_011240 [Ascochyta lentis]